jgi:hypothetical protein
MSSLPSDLPTTPCTAFAGHRRIASGPLGEVALTIKACASDIPVLVFDDATGRVIDLDLRGTDAEVLARLGAVADNRPGADSGAPAQVEGLTRRPRGRPRLGVTAREVTLLPRHWEWLAAQPGGASQALRRLVDAARRNDGGQSRAKTAQERVYRFLAALAGDLPGYEEVIRALFAGDLAGVSDRMAAWPPDLAEYALHLAQDAPTQEQE